jgi:DNA-binding response OmpR family regulator
LQPDTDRTITVLAISSSPEDHSALEAVFVHSRWRLYHVLSHAQAAALLSEHPVQVIIVDADVQDGTWRDFLSLGKSVSGSPLVIVASGLTDERLWAEALNIGAFDVLAKPFRAREVFHSVSLAWRCWKERCEECTCAASA